MGSRAERGATKRRAARLNVLGGRWGWRGRRGVTWNIWNGPRLSEELFDRRGLPKHLGLLEQGRESVTRQSPRVWLLGLGNPRVDGDGDKREGDTLQERPKETHVY
jgi:hypothetical protein